MKVVFMGSPRFAVPSLDALVRSSHEVLEVVTPPDRPAGRGRSLRPSPVGELAASLGLVVSKPARFRAAEVTHHLRELAADLFVVVAFGEILRKRHLEIPPLGCVNVHPSLLPRHRGAVPVQGTLLAGDDVAGVTTMRVARGVDTGDMYLQEAVEVEPGESAGSLEKRLAVIGASLLLDTLDGLEAGTLEPVPQDPERASETTRLSKDDGVLDWRHDAISVYRRVRAMTPWPGARTTRESAAGARSLTLTRAVPADDLPARASPGEVVALKRGPVVACGRGHLRIVRVKPAGSNEMTGEAFVRGHRVELGETWGG